MSFENYRGQPDLLEHAKTTVGILQGVKDFEARGGEMPKGMLLSGRARHRQDVPRRRSSRPRPNLPFIYIDASSLRGMFWGMTELMVMKLFRDARGLGRKYAQPGQRGACIVFMDEIDSIGMNRGGQGGGGMMMGGMMMGGGTGPQHAAQPDGLAGRPRRGPLAATRSCAGSASSAGRSPNKPLVFVIGATNRPEVLDPALIRPGRLDRMLEVYRPDAEGRRDIIQHYLAKKPHDPDIPIELMVNDSIGWTPIMIKTIINEALILAHEDGREFLTYKDWLDAADERALGLKQPIRSWNLDRPREIAYHEAGHAVAAHYLQPENRISKATIIRRGHALGFVQQRPREERTSLLRALDRDPDHGLAGGPRRREQVPRHAVDRSVERPPRRPPNRRSVRLAGSAMGPTKLVVPMPPGQLPIGAVRGRRPTSCSTTCTRRPSGCSARRSRRSTISPRR